MLFIVTLLILFVGLWTAAGISELVEIRKRFHSGDKKKKVTFWKVIISIFVLFEKKIWWLTGLRLPMYRRRLIRQARMIQYQLNREHGTFIAYPLKKPRKRLFSAI